MKVKCSHCGQSYEVDSTFLDKIVNCSDCGRDFTVDNPVKKSVDTPPTRQNNMPAATFRRPALAWVFFITGGVVLALTGLCVIVGIAMAERLSIIAMLPAAVVGIIISIFFIGIAEIISAICETAFNTREMLKLMREK